MGNTTNRHPPECEPWEDSLAQQCEITPVSYKQPIPPMTWCHYCGFLANSRDHIVPDSDRGLSAWWNLVPSCSTCNQAKATRQECSCLFCLRAMALWSLGFRRSEGELGKWQREKARKKAKRNEC